MFSLLPPGFDLRTKLPIWEVLYCWFCPTTHTGDSGVARIPPLCHVSLKDFVWIQEKKERKIISTILSASKKIVEYVENEQRASGKPSIEEQLQNERNGAERGFLQGIAQSLTLPRGQVKNATRDSQVSIYRVSALLQEEKKRIRESTEREEERQLPARRRRRR